MMRYVAIFMRYWFVLSFIMKLMYELVSNEELNDNVNVIDNNYFVADHNISDNTDIDNTIDTNRIKRLFVVNCSELLIGQYVCSPPNIDRETQQPYGCNNESVAHVNCTLIDGLMCDANGNNTFAVPIACQYTNGYSFETALLLSIFLGMFGADRFYLGYPALGLLKFCTLGFLFLGQLVDIVLIAMQIVRPADGSYYIIKYFGPKLNIVVLDNDTDILYNEGFKYYIT